MFFTHNLSTFRCSQSCVNARFQQDMVLCTLMPIQAKATSGIWDLSKRLMNSKHTRKTPPCSTEKRKKPEASIPTPPVVRVHTALEVRERQRELDRLFMKAREECNELAERCQKNPYDDEAFAAYYRSVDALWEALRLADPDRYTRELPRRLEVETAYPYGFGQAMAQLQIGDTDALELPVRFLETDPWVFQSGYVKARLIRIINRLEIPQNYLRRLQQVVLAVVDKADGRREFRAYCRLARKVDTTEFRQELESRLTVPNAKITRCAQWVLDACRKK